MADGSLTGVDERASFVLQTQEKMFNKRGNFNTLWQTVAERVLPNYSDFTQTHSPGQRRTNRVFDPTPGESLAHGVAALESMLCPASQRWHTLRPMDPRLQQDISIMQYMDQVTDCLFRARYAPQANFQSQIGECFSQIMAFGNGPLMVDDIVGYGLRYRARSLCNVFGIENAAGMIDWVHDKWDMSAAAACDALKRKMFDGLPEIIKESATKEPLREFTFIKSIRPNEDYIEGSRKNGHKFVSCIIAMEQKFTCCEYGYDTQPLLLPRYRVIPTETYGRGPGVDILPEILMLNEMRKIQIRQGQRVMEPPLLTDDDGSLPAFDLRGNAINYGYLTPDGKARMQALELGGNFEVTKEMLDDSRTIISRAFLNDIFSILIQQPTMTATEVLQRAQEKGYLLAPICGRVQTELFDPMITRELDILNRAGQLPPLPDKLKKAGGLEYQIVYQSQIQTAQKQSKALAIGLVFQQAAPLIQADPNVLKSVNMDRTFANLVEFNGAPADMLNTPEETAANQEAAAQQQQLTNLAQIAGPASQAIKNLSQANQAAGAPVPGNTLGGQ